MTWKTVKLGELCEIKPPKRQVKSNLSDDDLVSFVPMCNLNILSKNLTLEESRPLGEVYGSYTYFADGDVLLAKITPCFENGKIGIASGLVNGVGFGSSEYNVFRSKGEVLPDYLFYFLSQDTFRKEGEKVMSGAVGHKRVKQKFIEEYSVPFPPLSEQERIVAKLDAAFAAIDQAIEKTDQSLRYIKRIFLKFLDDQVNSPSLGSKVLLGDVCELSQGLAINKKTRHLLVEKSSKALLRIKDLINQSEEQFIDENYSNHKTEVNEEDLIFTRTGSLGITFRGRRGVLHNNSFKVMPKKSLSKDYLFWWLKNPNFLAKIHKVALKAAQPDISHKLFKAQTIRIPSLDIQQSLAEKIQLSHEICNGIINIKIKKILHLKSLKTAILTQELQPKESEAA